MLQRATANATHVWLPALLLCLGAGCSGSGLLDSLDALTAGSQESEAIAGLKEALKVGTTEAVSVTSSENGFLDNPLIRIALPDSLDTMAKGLRVIGQGRRVDELEVAMNRAAERAAGEAQQVFWDAIRAMNFSDALSILNGGDTAATDYLERTTRDSLSQRFRPIVSEKMDEVGLARLYDDLASRYDAMPFTTKPALDLRGYVTDKSLDGLFTVLGQEEQRIRTDPAARVTPLLQKVFGK